MKTNLRIQRAGAAVLMFGALALSACASMNNKERGAVIGATAGAAVAAHSTAAISIDEFIAFPPY